MDTLTIYRNNSILEIIKPDDSSSQAKRIMGENELRIAFRMDHYTDFNINDYCNCFGEKYMVNFLPQVVKKSRYYYEYNLTMQAEGFDLTKAQYLLFQDSDFSLMGNSDTFIDLIISNANRVSSGWVKGQVVPSAYKNLSFKAVSCYNALADIAGKFETEFTINGRTISLTQKAKDTGLTFRHGRFKGLYDITRTNVDSSNVITRLYVLGSEKNLPVNYRGTAVKRLKMPIVPAIPITDFGDYIELNKSAYGLIEGSQIFEDVYPHRTGLVTSVNATNFLVFTDSAIDFDINNQLIPGISAKIIFNTGQLAGYTFEIEKYNNTTKEITILKNKDEVALNIPNSSLKPAIGDKYIIVDIIMPQSYVYLAERELKNKAIAALSLLSEPRVQYSLTPDPLYILNKNLTLNIGDLIWIDDAELGVSRQIRIISTSRNLLQQNQYTVELADVLTKGVITQLQNNSSSQNTQITQVVTRVSSLGENNLGSLPTVSDITGYSQVYINDVTGKLYRKI